MTLKDKTLFISGGSRGWRIPTGAGEDLETELRRFLRATFRAVSRETGPVLAALMAEAQRDKPFATEFRKRLIDVRREALRNLLTRARDRGELNRESNLDLLADIVYGTMWYRLLVGHAKLDDRLADSLAQLVTTIGGTGPAPA